MMNAQTNDERRVLLAVGLLVLAFVGMALLLKLFFAGLKWLASIEIN